MDNLIAIADLFKLQENKVLEVKKFGSGNINHTFLVTTNSTTEPHFVLQRLNTKVFHQPELVMNNISTCCNRLRQELQQTPLKDRRWEVPRVLRVKNSDRTYYIDSQSSFWRGISYISNSQSFDTVRDTKHGWEVGYGLGMFHNLIGNLDVTQLADTLPGFHITPNYLQNYQIVLKRAKVNNSSKVDYCLKFISDRAASADILETARERGELKLRPIHGDPKVNNILLDRQTQQAIALIDLDTVKPGLIHYDIGDCLRSACNLLGEETSNWQNVYFDLDLARSILQGYLSVAKFLTSNDYRYLYEAIRLLAFELGLRFFTDYLAGNIYFQVKYPEQNLNRALVQFKLAQSIEVQKGAIKNLIHS
ncbi:phosphotransferase enzyme family protein [Myxosarcina sp. GI1]|uniref:phosphotransferase enzyme family protein n=1 Tax=Myxosarcina sp. GI1 TaxID=1541065 RepID=UPI000AC65ADE|nr:aminoglycoside phosphotransferase family protein [Myxosarcina sp. GI1]